MEGIPILPGNTFQDPTVLQFYAWFKMVHESPTEHYGVCHVHIFYYLEDDSIAVLQPRIDNSGIKQGVIIRRQRISKNDVGQLGHWTWKEINNGTNITIYGKSFHVYDCDKRTKDWLESQGIEINAMEDCPDDSCMVDRKNREPKKTMQTPSDFDKLQQFLEMDHRILRFYCVWDDHDQMFGQMRKFIMHYYLSDDTMEIREMHIINDGYDSFPCLIYRHRIPKDHYDIEPSFPLGATEITDKGVKEYFSPNDFKIGKTILVYNQRFLIYDLDNFTKAFYWKNFGMTDFTPADVVVNTPVHVVINTPMDVVVKQPDPPVKEYPPCNRPTHGCVDDSMENCWKVVPEPPRKDDIKVLDQQGIVAERKECRVNNKTPSENDLRETYIYSKYHPGKVYPVNISAFFHLGKFFCQDRSTLRSLNRSLEYLNALYEGGIQHENSFKVWTLAMEQICCAKSKLDRRWHRGRILALEGEYKATVQFVDTGEEELLSFQEIRLLHKSYVKIPVRTMACRLSGAEFCNRDLSAAELRQFEELSAKESVFVKIVQCDPVLNGYEVELFDGIPEESHKFRIITASLEQSEGHQALKEPVQHVNFNYQQIQIKIGDRKKVTPSWKIGPHEFYCQLEENTDVIMRLQESLVSAFDGLNPMINPQPGDACATPCKQFDGLYRGLVMSVKDPVASVLYVDYGNVETVLLTKMKQLTEQFAEVPAQALKCGLSGTEPQPKSPWSSDVLSRLVDVFSKPVCVTFTKKLSDRYLVELMSESGLSLNKKILEEPKVSSASLASLTYKTKVAWKPEETFEVEVVAVDEGHFFCRLVGKADEFHVLMAQLAECYGALEGEIETSELKAGQPCAAKSSKDGVWYRARIERFADDGQILVWFVDYGNKELQMRTDVKSLKPQFFDLPIQALKYALAGDLRAGDILMNMILGRQFKATLKKTINEILYVDLIGGDGEIVDCHSKTLDLSQNINSSSSDFKQKIQIAIPTNEVSVRVISVVTPAEFFVQMIDYEEELVAMGNRLHADYSFLSSDERCMKKFEIGELCCAKFQEDSVWYRAMIQEVTGSVVKVLFVDYGNLDTVLHVDVKELHNVYREIPFYAKRCSLKGITCPTNGWAEDEIKKFVVMTQVGEKVFSCAFVTAEEPFDVVLRDGGEVSVSSFPSHK